MTPREGIHALARNADAFGRAGQRPMDKRIHFRAHALATLAFSLGAAWCAFGVPQPASGAPVPLSQDRLCPQRLHMRHPELCSSRGPSALLMSSALQGLYPLMPLPAMQVDPALGEIPFQYHRLPAEGAPTFASYRDAVHGNWPSGQIAPGQTYLSYSACEDADGVAVYSIEPGIYVRGGEECGHLAMPRFRGMAFSHTPSHPFGWMLGSPATFSAPGPGTTETGNRLAPYDVVQIYESATLGGWQGFRIGAEEWVEAYFVAVVDPDPTPPEGVPGDSWISVNLQEQTVAVYDHRQLVYATLASTGAPGRWTRPGLFQVVERLEHDDMEGGSTRDPSDAYFLEDVPWVLYFDGGRALHAAYWHNRYGFPHTHGCVNLAPVDAHWLYNWAELGTWVYVWDPSGRTPTDLPR